MRIIRWWCRGSTRYSGDTNGSTFPHTRAEVECKALRNKLKLGEGIYWLMCEPEILAATPHELMRRAGHLQSHTSRLPVVLRVSMPLPLKLLLLIPEIKYYSAHGHGISRFSFNSRAEHAPTKMAPIQP